jgi:hypothetical protein
MIVLKDGTWRATAFPSAPTLTTLAGASATHFVANLPPGCSRNSQQDRVGLVMARMCAAGYALKRASTT